MLSPGRPFSRARLALGGAVLTVSLSACATTGDLSGSPAPKPPKAYAGAQSLSAPTADWPVDAWWRTYGDAQLTQLVDEALAGSPSMAAAQARVRRADALAAQARAATRVQVGAQVNGNAAAVDTGDLLPPGVGPSGIQTTALGLLSLSYDFDLWGRHRNALAAARGEADASRADLAQARLTLSTAVAGAYAELLQLHRQRDAVNEGVEVRRQTERLMSERQQNGLENRGSVSQAAAGRAAAEADAAALDEAIGLQRNRLAALLGAGPDRGLAITRPANPSLKAFGLPAQLQANLVGRRPDIVAARLRADAAAKRIDQARSGFYPNVNLSAMAGGLLLDVLSPAAPLLFAAAGPALTLPLYGGGRVDAQVKQARAEYEAAVADYDHTVAEAFREVADVTVSERALERRLTLSRSALTASQEANRVAGERYRGGLSNLLDVLRTEDALIANRRAVADLETRALLLDLNLIRALGGGYAEPSQEEAAND